MSRKRKNNPSPRQLSLEDQPGFWSEGTSPRPKTSESQAGRGSSSVREEATKYQATPKVTAPVKPTFEANQYALITVPVETTFDPCQGIREAKLGCKKNLVPSEIVFEFKHIELASQYASEPKLDELFYPKDKYLLGLGGLVNTRIFVDLLRCYGTLAKWSDDLYHQTGTRPIDSFKFIRPDANTPVGQLWEILGMPGLTEKPPKNLWTPGVGQFQSCIMTPLLMVNSINRNHVLQNVHNWLDYIYERIGKNTYYRLWQVVCEVVKNLEGHGHKGIFGVSVWPSGQIEIIWSNPIDHIHGWPPEGTALSLANSLLNNKGAGMGYIFDDLLPHYKGILIANWKTQNVIFNFKGILSIPGLKPRNDFFVPRSILFTLQLFCQETRKRSRNNANQTTRST